VTQKTDLFLQDLIKMGRIDVPQRRRISFLPEPPTITEDQARYIRLPTKEEIIEEERVPRVTYEDQLEHVEGNVRENTQQREHTAGIFLKYHE
jgi:hypothetical protein